MSAELSAFLSRITHYMEHFLRLIDEMPVLSPDLAFLKTLLRNAIGYLQKDVAPDTEALENWDTPENQRMLRRYIRHLTNEIRMVAENVHQEALPDEISPRLAQRMLVLLHHVEAEQRGLELLLRAQQGVRGNGEHFN